MARIIVVEDDAELNRTVCSYLGLRRYEARGLYQRQTAQKLVERMLALVKKVVDVSGGDVLAESEPGAGAAFTVTLSLAARG